jgi:hypothetical protein
LPGALALALGEAGNSDKASKLIFLFCFLIL